MNNLMKKFNLTEADVRLIGSEANAVWEECAYDIFAEMKPGKTIPRSHVLEIVLDADRLRDRVRRHRNARPELKAVINRDDFYPVVSAEIRKYLTKEVFKYSRYGL